MTVIPCHGLRADVHALLDDIWQNATETGGYDETQVARHGAGICRKARRRVYDWLAEQMWLLPKDCHVTRFSFDQCIEAISLLRGTTYAEIRAWAHRRERDRARAERIERRRAA